MVRSSTAIKKQRTTYLIGTIFIGLTVLVISLYALSLGSSKKVEINNKTDLCPKERNHIPAHVVFLIDTTSTIGVAQKAWIEVDIKRTLSELESYSLVTFFEVQDNADESAKALLSICLPRRFDPEKDSTFTTGKEFYEKIYREKFAPRIDERLQTQMESIERAQSPIFQTLQAIKTNGFDRELLSHSKVPSSGKGTQSRLIVYSDLLQHDQTFSMFRGIPTYEAFVMTDYGAKSVPQLNDVAITINVLQTRPDIQRQAAYTDFWRRLFANRGARVTDIRYIPG